ncbi:MAG: response regulator [Butyricicoccaceae bacterium]
MMYQVLLVDDDLLVHMFLKNAVCWEDYGFSIAGDARDGIEALELCAQLQPDLILTDISMPGMDGVEMIRQLRSSGYHGVITVLSCHDDFELVKSAMKWGADDYLVKNDLSDSSLGELLEKIRVLVDEKHAKAEQKNVMQSLVQKGIRSAQRELLEGILSDTLTGETLAAHLRQAGLKGKYRRTEIVLAQVIGADADQSRILFEICARRLEHEAVELLHLSDCILVILFDLTDVPSIRQTMDWLNRLQNIVENLSEQYLSMPTALASSLVCEGDTALTDALRQAYQTLQMGFYGAGRWQYGQDGEMSAVCPSEAEQFVHQLPELMKNPEIALLQRQFEMALSAVCEHRVMPGVLLQWLRRCDHAAGVMRAESEYSSLRQFSQYASCVNAYRERHEQLQQIRIPTQTGPAIRQAVVYIQEHFSEQIGLGHAARHVGLTPPYLSTLFKQEMGVGFSEYLLSLRLNWVCEHLISTTKTIKQISQEAGFVNYQYFCKMFKKHLGVSPAVYRKNHCGR